MGVWSRWSWRDGSRVGLVRPETKSGRDRDPTPRLGGVRAGPVDRECGYRKGRVNVRRAVRCPRPVRSIALQPPLPCVQSLNPIRDGVPR